MMMKRKQTPTENVDTVSTTNTVKDITTLVKLKESIRNVFNECSIGLEKTVDEIDQLNRFKDTLTDTILKKTVEESMSRYLYKGIHALTECRKRVYEVVDDFCQKEISRIETSST